MNDEQQSGFTTPIVVHNISTRNVSFRGMTAIITLAPGESFENEVEWFCPFGQTLAPVAVVATVPPITDDEEVKMSSAAVVCNKSDLTIVLDTPRGRVTLRPGEQTTTDAILPLPGQVAQSPITQDQVEAAMVAEEQHRVSSRIQRVRAMLEAAKL